VGEAGHSEHTVPVFIILSVYSEFDYARRALRLGGCGLSAQAHGSRGTAPEDQPDFGITEADNTPQNRELIEICVEYLKANYMKEIRQEQCAQMIHFSQSYFSILF
jgi:YesN/AraC family two-component response regulator